MRFLEPRLVLSSGVPATGKTSTLKEIARKVGNAFYLDRDDILMGLLYVAPTKSDELLEFEKYVANDDVFPDNARYVETPFGKMLQVDPKNAFNRRHGRDQSYLVQAEVARKNLDLGKVPMLDCIVMRQIMDGTLRKFIDYQLFDGYKKYLLHFVADEEDCYQRMLARAKVDKASAIRDREIIESKNSFKRIFREKHIMYPNELENYECLVVNTSNRTIEECAELCIDYMSK